MKRPREIPLGSYTLPSGNSCDAFFIRGPEESGALRVLWDVPPPFSPADDLAYRVAVMPAIIRRLGEYLEKPNLAATSLVVRLG